MEITQPRRKRNLISLTSLIDVVFILLVFFMLTSNFTRWNTIELGISTTDSITLKNTQQSLIEVKQNAYILNGKASTLADIISYTQETLYKQPDHTILVKPEKQLPLQQLVIVLEALEITASHNIALVKEEF